MTDRRMRVMLVGSVPPPLGGMSIFVEQFLRSDLSRLCNLSNLSADLLGKHRYRGRFRTIMNVLNAVALLMAFCWRHIRSRPNIVHVLANSYAGFFEKTALCGLARLLGCRAVLHVHGGAFWRFYFESGRFVRWAIRVGLGWCNSIIVLSSAMRQVFLDIGVRDERLFLAENAVNIPPPDAANRSDIAGRPLRVLFLNRIVLGKGIIELLAAADLVRRTTANVEFRIVGPDSADKRALQQLVQDGGLADFVRLLPPVTGQAKDQAFRDADIYVLPSHVEAVPMGLLEAMSYSLPCVVTAVGGVPGIINDGRNGILIPAKDSASLAEAIIRLAEDPDLRRELGSRARQTVVDRCEWGKLARRFLSLYARLLGQPAPAPCRSHNADVCC